MIPEGSSTPDSHGTSICSVIFGNSEAVRGIAPGCSGLVLPIFFGTRPEDRPSPASQLDLARAITFALEHDVSIINVSAGQKVGAPEADTHLDQALRRCAERRVLVVAAAGNDACACLHLPAGVASVLAVGASDSRGDPLTISNWGEPYRQNGLLAPGEGLTVAVPGGGTLTASGTSYATAVVSGVAALLLSVARREGYHIDAVDIQRILINSSTPCQLEGEGACDRYLAGKLDAAAALAMLHEIGAGPQVGLSKSAPAVSTKLNGAENIQPHTLKGGDRMTNGILVQSDAVLPDAAGVAPSACACQTKSEGEPGKTAEAVKQQEAPAISPSPTLPPVQNASLGGLNQQACACGGGQPPQIVYALGSLWFDFGTEARHDLFVQQIQQLGPARDASGQERERDANRADDLLEFLSDDRFKQFAAGLTFTLMQELVPLYAIQPAGPFAPQAYNFMLEALTSCLAAGGNDQRVSIAGFMTGSTRLLNGMVVPVVVPDRRGMYKWRSDHLI